MVLQPFLHEFQRDLMFRPSSTRETSDDLYRLVSWSITMTSADFSSVTCNSRDLPR